MNRHLKYIDGNSDKFWQIEVAGASYTVTYGRNGTSGTSQTKTFSNDDECLKMAEKLLNEKIKKGYSENGEVVLSQPIKGVKKADSNINEILGTFDALVKSGDVAGLLPFLKEHAKGNLEAIKKQIRKNKKYWIDFIDLSKEPGAKLSSHSSWGIRANVYQKEVITLSALALFNKTEVTSWDELFEVLGKASEPQILAVLQWSTPNWISDFILEKCRKNDWMQFDYRALRFLESHSLISSSPELYALSIATFREWTAKIKPREYIHYILNDPLAYQRDVPELFNYETPLHASNFRDKDTEPYDAHNIWAIIYDTLLSEGKLKRDHFVEQAILIQTKDWNNAVKSFFRKRLIALQLSADELLPYQENIFASLQNPYAPIVNFALEMIKKMYEEKKFNVSSFLEWLTPVMMSADHKGAIKTVFPILEKLNKHFPKFNKKIVDLVADVYVVPDLSLQEKATRLLLKIAAKKDHQLSEKLSGYVPLMQGNVPASLSPFLGQESQVFDPEVSETYLYQPKREKLLIQEIVQPKDWNDIVFLFGKFIASDDVADAELLLNTFITQRQLFPKDYARQLQPYKVQLEKKYFESTHKSYMSVFLQQKAENYNYTFKVQDSPYYKIKTLLLIKPLLHAVQQRMDTKVILPMLSFPSHLPHWVAPKVLIERLIAYQKSGTEINKLDLSIAISRMPREQVEEAIPLLEQLDGELKKLMSYCLGHTNEIMVKSSSIWNKLLSKVNAEENNNIKSVWATAARTYDPSGIFPEFENTYLNNLPFAVTPFRPSLKIDERWNEYMNYQTKQKERSPSWYELSFSLPAYQNTPGHFLYALDMFGRKNSYEYMMGSEGNVYFWHSLMPQNADALGCFLLRSACIHASAAGHELKGFLYVVNQPGFLFSDTTMLVFACTFFQDKKEVRLMASEVLINLIEKRTIDLTLFAKKIAYLASNKYGPFLRLIESLSNLKDVSRLHNSAFLQLLEGIIKHLEIQEKLPVNFKKLVEHYIDVLYKTRQQPSSASIAFFEKYKDTASLKSLTKQILK